MREILFRGKRTDNGEWIKGYLLGDEITGQYFIHASGNSVNESPKVGEEGVLHFLAFEVIPETVGQWTGLKDKNGKQIFEGDIIKGAWKTRLKVYFDDVCLQFRVRKIESAVSRSIDYYCGRDGYEIIGNIHDNPELMEVEA